jgi:bacterial/archaeal transporter family protein
MWKIYALLAALFAAITAILAKAGVRDISGNTATAIRTTVVLVIAWCIVFATGEAKGLKDLSRNNVVFLILSGIATGLSWIFYFQALETGPISKVAGIDKLSVALAIILAFLFLKEPMEWKTIVGGLLIVTGTIVMIS